MIIDPYVLYWVENFHVEPQNVSREMRQYAKLRVLSAMYVKKARVLADIILAAQAGRRCPKCGKRMTFLKCSECNTDTVQD